MTARFDHLFFGNGVVFQVYSPDELLRMFQVPLARPRSREAKSPATVEAIVRHPDIDHRDASAISHIWRISAHTSEGTAVARLCRAVPSLPHESYVELFRNCGLLARELLRGRIQLPSGELVAESLSADFSQVVPTEYRADHVIALRSPGADRTAPPDLVVIIEVQLSIDPRKGRTWPIYVTTAAGEHYCEVQLLVIAPDPHVARWAAGPFGPSPTFKLHPIVISFEELPSSIDAETAQRFPELAVLVAIAHPTIDTATTALTTIRSLSLFHSKLYFDLVSKALAEAGRSILEIPMIEGYK